MRDDILLRLHDALKRTGGGYASLTEEERRAYHAEANRKARARAKQNRETGDLRDTAAVTRSLLADAAIMILATGAPGADQIRSVLQTAYAGRPGIPLRIEQRCRSGRIRPKLARLG